MKSNIRVPAEAVQHHLVGGSRGGRHGLDAAVTGLGGGGGAAHGATGAESFFLAKGDAAGGIHRLGRGGRIQLLHKSGVIHSSYS